MIHIDNTQCDVCGTCAGVCAVNAIIIVSDSVRVDHEVCELCRSCIAVCQVEAIYEDGEQSSHEK